MKITIISVFHGPEIFVELPYKTNDLLHSDRCRAEKISLAILETG